MKFTDIKLIIWDLDETFWQGTLSDGAVSIPEEHKQLIHNMADAGVVSSICSKNDADRVSAVLKQHALQDLFVFPSVNWTPKGERVRQIISSMNLRAPNVLFLDDNSLNRAEVLAACPGITAADVDLIPELIRFFSDAQKKDPDRKRLQQYHVLQQKVEFQAKAGSNEQFLRESNIRVHMGTDCMAQLDRISDLILRSNQLNFTKIRSSREELEELFRDTTVRCGYVQVQDNFGDYGITGFYALKDRTLLHFVFSCRTLNMGVEQYVYAQLGSPELTVQGEVASEPGAFVPDWINQKNQNQAAQSKSSLKSGGKILIKGLCDMQQIFAFIHGGKQILTELVYVNDAGVSIESGCHTAHVVQSRTLSKEIAEHMITTLPFGDKDMYTTAAYDSEVSYFVLSLLTDANLGLYREKKSGAVVAFGEHTNDLTDETIWQDLMDKKRFVANCNFTMERLNCIKERYEFLGRATPEMTIRNLSDILEHMASDAKLILLLGCELPYEANTQEAYVGRHLYHKLLNDQVRDWARDNERVILLDINDYVHSQDDFTNNINHYTKQVYYKLSQKLIEIINQNSTGKLRESTVLEQKLRRIGAMILKVPQKIRRLVRKYLSTKK